MISHEQKESNYWGPDVIDIYIKPIWNLHLCSSSSEQQRHVKSTAGRRRRHVVYRWEHGLLDLSLAQPTRGHIHVDGYRVVSNTSEFWFIPPKLIQGEWRVYTLGNWTINGTGNGLALVRHQTIICINAGLLLVGTYISFKFELKYKIFQLRQCHLKLA